ncbi:MAG: MMPL family transporter [Magnetospirillum sp.]|nr:MMPL family transporter [Magnetospirillum sp.]
MRKALALLWLAVVLAACVHVAWLSRDGLPRETDIMALLPREEREPELQAAKDRVARWLSGRVVVLVGHKDRDKARAAALSLRAALVEGGLVRPESDIPGEDAVKRLGAAYFAHRAGLLAEEDRQRLLRGEGEALVKRALSQIYGFGGAVDSRLLVRDPFLLFPAFLGGLPNPASRVSMDEGLPGLVEDGVTWVLLSLRTQGEAFDLEFQNRFVAAFDTASSGVPEGTNVLRLGAVFFAQAGAEQAMAESARIGLVSLAGTVLLVVLTFRSLRPLLLSLAAIGAGLAAALSACLFLFGSLHVAAQMFGAALIGIAVDYALLYFGQIFTPRTDPAARLAHVLPGIALGAATTIIGYGALALSPFPGLHQVAVFSAIGLVGSFLSVILWFPLLDRVPAAKLNRSWAAAAAGLWRFWGEAGWARARRIVLAVLVLVGVLGLARLEVDDDMRRQQGLDPAGRDSAPCRVRSGRALLSGARGRRAAGAGAGGGAGRAVGRAGQSAIRGAVRAFGQASGGECRPGSAGAVQSSSGSLPGGPGHG